MCLCVVLIQSLGFTSIRHPFGSFPQQTLKQCPAAFLPPPLQDGAPRSQGECGLAGFKARMKGEGEEEEEVVPAV